MTTMNTVERNVPQTNLNDTQMWQAVLESDVTLDGAFVFAVSSTGIYCRPSCPSRTPMRQNVSFFSDTQSAVEAGFRACKRCSPNTVRPDLELVSNVCAIIHRASDDRPTLNTLASETGISPHHLQRVFKRVTGISPREYADALRTGDLKSKLRDGWQVTGALYEAGYSSGSRLYEGGSSKLGMTPGEYRRGGAGISIRYTVVDCALGKLLVGATDKGLCKVSLGDDLESLEADLIVEYPNAELTVDDGQMSEWAGEIVQHLSGRRPRLDLPLDVQATAFERMVWDRLRKIPYGHTLSYSEIAQDIGKPKAARAVGNACASNPTAIVVPCHRAVLRHGGVGNYRWGADRKRKLLAQESEGASQRD